jgi:coproporphyrinogen III oxidase-like Fe-S oxidoreductase
MILNNIIQKWSVAMAQVKKAVEHLRKNKEITVELIPAYMSDTDFQEKKEEVQNLISRILISTHKRGRPSKDISKVDKYAA